MAEDNSTLQGPEQASRPRGAVPVAQDATPVAAQAAQPQQAPEAQPEPERVPHHALRALANEEFNERMREDDARSHALSDIRRRLFEATAPQGGEQEYPVADHMAVARKVYGVAPEVAAGAAFWVGRENMTQTAMKNAIQAYAEREV